jgi:hypothetical protein
MIINRILEQQGWELVKRQSWTAVQDLRPQFRVAFNSSRVGKLIETRFYVTPSPLAEVTQGLVRQLGCDPVSIKSTSGVSDAVYWGIETNGVSQENLEVFVKDLAAAIEKLI